MKNLGKFKVATKNFLRRIPVNQLLFFSLLPFKHRVITREIDLARENLNKLSKRPQGTSLMNNQLNDVIYDLQIIVPAYNVENYLVECIDSIINQETQYSYQIVLIDDGSTDSTGKIADDYMDNDKVKVIHQNNRGLSGARNRGLSNLSSKYIMFVDSDDKILPNSIEALLNAAISNDADIVEGGCFRLYNDDLRPFFSYRCKNVIDSKKLKGFAWGKVYRREIFASVGFPEGFWFEDTVNAFLIYPLAKKVMVISDIVYVYRDNSMSITNTAKNNPKCIDTYWITEQMLVEHEQIGLPYDSDLEVRFLKQVLVNARRTSRIDDEYQKNIFELSCELYINIKGNIIGELKDKNLKYLQKSLLNNDYGMYKWFCKTHF